MEKYFIKEDIRNFINLTNEEYHEKIDFEISKLKDDITLRKEKCKITFSDNITKIISFGNYISYLIIFEPFNVFQEEISDDFIINIKDINCIEKYFDKIIEKFVLSDEYFDKEKDMKESYNKVGSIIVNIINNLNKVTCIITKKFGPTFDLFDFIHLAKRNKEFAKIMYEPELDENQVFNAKEIVKHTNDTTDKIKEIICNDKENTFKYFIESGSGVNMKQLGQIFGYVGLKPDLKEKIIPKPINTNFCNGLRNVTDFYINSVGCLKALITSHIQVKNSGYFTRKLLVLLNDEFVSDVKDCGTKHLLPMVIKNENELKHLNYRYFSMYPSGKNMERFNIGKKDYSYLIGKTVYLRDPITCACKDGICEKCYGDLWKVNYKMNVGIIACLILTNDFTQTMLGTKHLLQAKVKKREYSESFNKYFEFDLDKIILKDEYSEVTIELELIDSNEEKDKEYFVYRFAVIDGKEKSIIEEEIPFTLNDELSENIESYFNKETNAYVLKPKVLNDIEFIFSQNIDNNGLSRTMLLVKELIDKNIFISEHNVYEIYEKFVDLIEETNASIDYIHLSVIVKNMMDVIGGREQFKTSKELPPIKVYNISDAIHHLSKSVSKPLLFEHIKKHFTSDTYNTLEKDGYSNYDDLLR